LSTLLLLYKIKFRLVIPPCHFRHFSPRTPILQLLPLIDSSTQILFNLFGLSKFMGTTLKDSFAHASSPARRRWIHSPPRRWLGQVTLITLVDCSLKK
jgi:hypothetical protein